MAIYTLEQMRDSAPAELKGVSDAQLVTAYAENQGLDVFDVAEYYGIETGRDKSIMGSALSSAAHGFDRDRLLLRQIPGGST